MAVKKTKKKSNISKSKKKPVLKKKTKPKVQVKKSSRKALKKTTVKKESQKPVSAQKTLKKKPVKKRVVKEKKLSAKSQKLLKENERKWQALQNKHQEVSALNYKISGVYKVKTPIMHKKFGWGYILSVRNDRLEVIFKESVKFLVSNNLGVIR